MKNLLRTMVVAAAMIAGSAGTAQAWHIHGRVICVENGTPLFGVVVTITSGGQVATATTDIDGFYTVNLDEAFTPALTARTYNVTLSAVSLPSDAVVISPAGGEAVIDITDTVQVAEQNFIVSSSQCTPSACWLTGGGQKRDPLLDIPVAEKGPRDSFGGNVNPGCSPTSGDGGNWNHIARGPKLHFQGQHIEVVRCGNVPGIPEGSTSPATPFNFIEFEGTGRLNGIAGNKASHDLVYFFGRAEDRNEPGSSAVADVNGGELVDRYLLHVFSNPADPAGSTLLMIDNGAGGPGPITHGNLQIHVSSCSTP
jgi:hypothetical protein